MPVETVDGELLDGIGMGWDEFSGCGARASDAAEDAASGASVRARKTARTEMDTWAGLDQVPVLTALVLGGAMVAATLVCCGPRHQKSFSASVTSVCSICLEVLRPCSARVLDCGHTFHDKCIAPWLQRQHACPECRAVVEAPDGAQGEPARRSLSAAAWFALLTLMLTPAPRPVPTAVATAAGGQETASGDEEEEEAMEGEDDTWRERLAELYARHPIGANAPSSSGSSDGENDEAEVQERATPIELSTGSAR